MGARCGCTPRTSLSADEAAGAAAVASGWMSRPGRCSPGLRAGLEGRRWKELKWLQRAGPCSPLCNEGPLPVPTKDSHRSRKRCGPLSEGPPPAAGPAHMLRFSSGCQCWPCGRVPGWVARAVAPVRTGSYTPSRQGSSRRPVLLRVVGTGKQVEGAKASPAAGGRLDKKRKTGSCSLRKCLLPNGVAPSLLVSPRYHTWAPVVLTVSTPWSAALSRDVGGAKGNQNNLVALSQN